MNNQERFGFFDGDGEVYEYGQEDLMLFFSNAFTSGIRVSDDGAMDFSIKVLNQNLVVSPGYGVLNGCFYFLKTDKSIPINLPVGFPKMIRAVIQLSYNERKISIVLKEGVEASKPQPPDIVRNELYFELSLCQMQVDTNGGIVLVDERYMASVCGDYKPRNNTAFDPWFKAVQKSMDEWFKIQQGTGWTQMFTTEREPQTAVAGAHWFAPLEFK